MYFIGSSVKMDLHSNYLLLTLVGLWVRMGVLHMVSKHPGSTLGLDELYHKQAIA